MYDVFLNICTYIFFYFLKLCVIYHVMYDVSLNICTYIFFTF
jgi:hypothetical protein